MSKYGKIAHAAAFTSFLLERDAVNTQIERIIYYDDNTATDTTTLKLYIEGNIEETTLTEQQNTFSKVNHDRPELNIQTTTQPSKKEQKQINADGIVLYGQYEQLPNDVRHYTLFDMTVADLEKNEQVKVWRHLYGYTQTVNGNTYEKQGLVKQHNGRKLGDGMFIIPKINEAEAITFLEQHNVQYTREDAYMRGDTNA